VAHIDYYTFIASPWAYLGSKRFEAIAARHKATVRIIPMGAGAVFEASGGLPLAKRAKQRQDYRLNELRRWSEFLDIKVIPMPKPFPLNDTLAGKLVVAARDAGGSGSEDAIRLAHRMMAALWAEERDLANPEVLEEIINEAALDPAKLFSAADSGAVQTEYDRGTQQAIEAGVFGAPFFVLNGEPFWGQDRLEFVDRALAKLA
jgi:2-hydroxychromene-2-carboxylate isomerase